MPNSPQALFLLVVLVIGLVSGQDDEVARLRARVSSHSPSSALAREEARQQAEGGVAAIPRPLTERWPPSRKVRPSSPLDRRLSRCAPAA